MKHSTWHRGIIVAAFIAMASAVLVNAHAPSGAIFTTLEDGSEVNVNQYAAKEDVYLDGGPGPGAPQTAAGLDDGTYVFQVTDPSGRTLLSTDLAECRQFTVSDGVIISTAPSSCPHNTGLDLDHNATTVQLFPYADTPNPGGVYKVWIVEVGDYLAGCAELGVTNGLAVIDCGRGAGNFHGFVPRHTKTDNFKVKAVPIREIDVFFIQRGTGERLVGRQITWTDPLGVPNQKWSYLVEFWNATEAHVEAVEDGDHQIRIEDQVGCAVEDIYANNFEGGTLTFVGTGPRTIVVPIRNHNKATSPYFEVFCK
jgi:hypothetical protein